MAAPPDSAPLSATAGGRVFHITSRKCGSQWVRDVLQAPELVRTGMPTATHSDSGNCPPVLPATPSGSFTGPIYDLPLSAWLRARSAGDRALVILRDPRDVVVSRLHSTLYSHGSTAVVDAERKLLRLLADQDVRLRYGVLNSAIPVQFMCSWLEPCASALVLRYESLLADAPGEFDGMLHWLGLTIPREAIETAVGRLSFEARSGRRPGDEDILSHFRKGVAGDWKNHFNRSHGELWEVLYPGALRRLGYEETDLWWESLPAQVQPLRSAEPDETEVLAARNRILESELGEKQAEIRRLATVAQERETLIQRLESAGAEARQSLAAREKEATLAGEEARHLEAAQRSLRAELSEKEAVISELARALQHLRLRRHGSPLLLQPAVRLYRHLTAGLIPRLGRLSHHPPRPLRQLPAVTRTVDREALPTVSLVTPSYNQGAFIERTIRSVLGQGYGALDYHVQDGASADETIAVVECFQPQLASFSSHPDRGQTHAINLALSRCEGELMGWLNSDDLLLPGALDRVTRFFADHPEVDVIYGDRLLIDEEDREIGAWILPPHDDAVLSWADFIPQETLFWRRSLWERTGGALDESFRFAMDWDLLVRFRDAGAVFAHLDAFLGAFRIHEAQKTSAVINEIGQAEMDRIRERCLGRVPSQAEIRRAVAPYLLRHLACHYRREFLVR